MILVLKKRAGCKLEADLGWEDSAIASGNGLCEDGSRSLGRTAEIESEGFHWGVSLGLGGIFADFS